MATVTHAGTTWNTTAGNKTVVATPAASDLIVVVAPCTLSGGTTAVTDNNSDGLGTYAQVDADRTGFSTAGVLTVWVREALVGSASSTTFTASQAGSTGGGLTVFRVSGMSRSGALAVLSSGGQSTGTAGTTPAPVLSATPQSANPIIAAVCNGTNSTTTVVERSGYTEASDLGYNTPATGFESCFLNSGETSATITFGGTSATAFASVAIELDTTSIPGPTITVFEVSSYTTTTTPKTITVTGGVTGDLIVVCMGGDNFNNAPSAASVSTTSGSTSAWTEQEERLNAANQVWQNISTATLTADGSVTVSLDRTQGTAQVWGGYAALCHDHGGVGNHTWLTPGTTDAVSLTTSQDSAVFMIGIDWDHQSVVAFTPAGAVDVERTAALTAVTWYAGYWRAQAAGSRNYGMSTNASSTVFGMAVVEVLAAAGGTTHTVDPTDSAGLTDTSAIEVVKAVTQTDSAGLTDAAIFDQAKAFTDSAGLADPTAFTISKIITDSAGLTDASAVELSKLIAQTDSAGLADSAVFTQAPAFTDSAGLTDGTLLARSLERTDSAGLTDAAVVESGKAVVQTDSAGLTDSQAFSQTKVQTDSIGLTDTAALAVSKVATDSAGLTDAASVGLLQAFAATDGVGLTDVAVLSRTAVLSDLVGLADATAFSQLRILTDSTGLTDVADVGAGIPPFVPRPDGGTTTRPSSGLVARPFGGVTPRP